MPRPAEQSYLSPSCRQLYYHCCFTSFVPTVTTSRMPRFKHSYQLVVIKLFQLFLDGHDVMSAGVMERRHFYDALHVVFLKRCQKKRGNTVWERFSLGRWTRRPIFAPCPPHKQKWITTYPTVGLFHEFQFALKVLELSNGLVILIVDQFETSRFMISDRLTAIFNHFPQFFIRRSWWSWTAWKVRCGGRRMSGIEKGKTLETSSPKFTNDTLQNDLMSRCLQR